MLPDYIGNLIKERAIKNPLKDLVGEERVEEIFELIKNQDAYKN